MNNKLLGGFESGTTYCVTFTVDELLVLKFNAGPMNSQFKSRLNVNGQYAVKSYVLKSTAVPTYALLNELGCDVTLALIVTLQV